MIDLQALDPIRAFLAELGDWPVLTGDSWDADNRVNVVDLLVKLALMNSKILIEQYVSADDKDSDVNILQVCLSNSSLKMTMIFKLTFFGYTSQSVD